MTAHNKTQEDLNKRFENSLLTHDDLGDEKRQWRECLSGAAGDCKKKILTFKHQRMCCKCVKLLRDKGWI
jgi:hypothetical protein